MIFTGRKRSGHASILIVVDRWGETRHFGEKITPKRSRDKSLPRFGLNMGLKLNLPWKIKLR